MKWLASWRKMEKGFPDGWWGGGWEEGVGFLVILQEWARQDEDDDQEEANVEKSPKRERDESTKESSQDLAGVRLLSILPTLHAKLRTLELQVSG